GALPRAGPLRPDVGLLGRAARRRGRAGAVARDLVVYLRRAGTDPAISPWLDGRNHMHPGVHRVQDAIVHNPAAAWTPQTLAAQAHISARHLSRLFAEHAGCTPMDYLYRVRLALARELIRETRLDLEHVAERAGFGSAHHMRRVWRRHESGSPSAARHPA
ncbi:helix-turn-helix domain-containing protein, partial [Bordetella pertussis]|uniref:helix-turn-helix domain-containing protein n=1 Tax=Bordetella pertussis TaxID=520 RepID=UPI0021CC2260